MNRYLTLEECAEELRVQRRTVLSLIKKKRLVGIEITPGHWRVADPSPALRERLLDSPLERIPFLSMHEVAEVLGITHHALKWDVRTGKAKPVYVEGGPKAKVFTVKELRRLAAIRDKRQRPRKLHYSRSIAKWLKGAINKDADVTAEAIQEMLDQVVKMPEPRKSQIIVELWALVDEVNRLLLEPQGIERREPKPPPRTSP